MQSNENYLLFIYFFKFQIPNQSMIHNSVGQVTFIKSQISTVKR